MVTWLYDNNSENQIMADDEKLNKLIKQRDQMNARIQREKAKETMRQRKLDTQAKILLGSALLNRLESKDEKAEELYQWCRDALTEKDRNRLDIGMGRAKKKPAQTTQENKPGSIEQNRRPVEPA